MGLVDIIRVTTSLFSEQNSEPCILFQGPNPKAAMELLKLDGLPQALTHHMAKGY